MLCCCYYKYDLYWIHVVPLPIPFRVALLALGKLYDCPNAYKETLQDMGKREIH